jgi:hypothetical protein
MVSQLRQVCPEEREHIRIELFVEGAAVKARRIRADLGPIPRQCRRTGYQEREVPSFRHHVIFVLRWRASLHGGDTLERDAIAAMLRRP